MSAVEVLPKIDKTNNPDELLDLVDENDRIIGEVLKSEANRNPNLWHREIAILIYKDYEKILFQQRSQKKKIDPGLWTISVGGHVPKGMDSEEAAHKELNEELGFDTNLKFIEKEIARVPNETHFIYWYIGKYPGEEIRVNKQEVGQVKFLSREEVEGLIKSGWKFENYSLKMARKFWEEKI